MLSETKMWLLNRNNFEVLLKNNLIYLNAINIILIVILSVSGGILLFYAVFYSSLACMFGICMKVLLSTLNDHTPHFTLTSSIIGTNPGMYK